MGIMGSIGRDVLSHINQPQFGIIVFTLDLIKIQMNCININSSPVDGVNAKNRKIIKLFL